MLRKYRTTTGILLDQNQKKLTKTSVNTSESSFKRKEAGNGLISTQQLPVDNSLFQNNTFFGSAEAKINVAFNKIINEYPFDGTLEEIETFEDNLSSLEKHVFNKFPKSRGFLTFDSSSSQYIEVKDKSGDYSQTLLKGEQGVSHINPRNNSFSIECCLRLPEESNGNSFLFHSINSTAGENSGYAVFFNQTASSKNCKVNFALMSGSYNYASASYTIKKGKWHNLSFQYDNRTEQQTLKILSGSTVLSTSDFFDYGIINTGNQKLKIGDGENLDAGNNNLVFNKSSTFSGSLDEFRLFHGIRDLDEVSYYSRRNIFAHDSLKLYFKFNEPTGSHTNNNLALDHSGNSLHTQISNYKEAMRLPHEVDNPMFLEDSHYNPVLFPSSPEVISLNSKLLQKATLYDVNNPNLITKLVPNHYLQEGAYLEGSTVDGDIVESYSSYSNLPKSGRLGHAQLISMFLYYMAEELDQYKMYIDQVSQFLNPDYLGVEGVADAFLPDLAKYYGFELPKVFGDVALEQFLGKENLGLEYSIYEKSLSEVQNLIWRRVLKNISHIFKSKGTKYAIESIFRSAGIEPDRLFRLVEYNGVDEFRLGTSRQKITEMSTLLNFSGSLSTIKETPRPDGTIIGRPTLLSAPLSGSRIEPGYPEISGGVNSGILATGTIKLHSTNQTALPSINTKVTIQDAYNNTEIFKFANSSASDKATSTLTVTDGDAIHGMTAGQKITIQSAAGTIADYFVSDTNDGGVAHLGIIANNALLKTTGNIRATLTPGAHKAIAVGFNLGAALAAGIDQAEFLGLLKAAIEHANGHDGKITVSAAPSAADGNQSITITQTTAGNIGNKSITNNISNLTPTNFSGGSIVINRQAGGSNKTTMQLVTDISTAITTAFPNSFNVETKNSAAGTNLDTIKITTKGFNRRNLGNHTISMAPSDSNLTLSGFSSGKGMVRANTPGYSYAGISASPNDGLFTSGSWTVEGIYQFPSNLSNESRRSLSRIVTQGVTPGQNFKDKHAVLSNLVLSPFGNELTLYVRNSQTNTAPVLKTILTGANCLDGKKWHITYGRRRNDDMNQPVSSSYFIRAASLDFDKLSTFIVTGSFFDEGLANDNMFQNLKHESENYNPPQILIGSQSMVDPAGNSMFINDSAVINHARTSYFDGKVGHIRFWSKYLTVTESIEHARNFKSVGVDNPLVSNTFSTSMSGSFQKLRLNISTDQPEMKSNPFGKLNFLDFSQTFTLDNQEKISNGTYTSLSGALGFGFEVNNKIVHNERFDYTIISPFFDEYLDSDKIKIAGFSDGSNIKLYNSKIAPVTEVLPFEKKANDNRFEVQIHLQRGLDEDIMNIFSAIDALDDALGKPELVFAQEYPDLRNMRNLYFNRLTEKVNYRNFFDLFRWLDDAFSDMIERLVPRNNNFLGINLIIESHALERYKVAYGHQEIYKGEDERSKLRSKILVSQRSGVIRRF
jgi:hypothetical protein